VPINCSDMEFCLAGKGNILWAKKNILFELLTEFHNLRSFIK